MRTLLENRKLAAAAAAGISSGPIYSAVMEVILRFGCKGTVLDFGAGTGGFAKLLESSGLFAKVHAADLIDYGGRALRGIDWSFCDLNSGLPFEDGSFDVVAAVEVIEHLESPRHLAREWFRLLKPSGHIIISTPNNESWRSLVSLIFRGHFSAFTGGSYPAHITAVLRLDLTRSLTEAGFMDIEFFYTNNGGLPGHPRKTWQQLSFGLLTGLRFSDNLVCHATKPR